MLILKVKLENEKEGIMALLQRGKPLIANTSEVSEKGDVEKKKKDKVEIAPLPREGVRASSRRRNSVTDIYVPEEHSVPKVKGLDLICTKLGNSEIYSDRLFALLARKIGEELAPTGGMLDKLKDATRLKDLEGILLDLGSNLNKALRLRLRLILM